MILYLLYVGTLVGTGETEVNIMDMSLTSPNSSSQGKHGQGEPRMGICFLAWCKTPLNLRHSLPLSKNFWPSLSTWPMPTFPVRVRISQDKSGQTSPHPHHNHDNTLLNCHPNLLAHFWLFSLTLPQPSTFSVLSLCVPNRAYLPVYRKCSINVEWMNKYHQSQQWSEKLATLLTLSLLR